MDLKVDFVINVVPATITEVVVEIISAQLLGEFWASHIVKARKFREILVILEKMNAKEYFVKKK